MNKIEASDLERGLTLPLDRLEVCKFERCLVKARPGSLNWDLQYRYRSFLLLKFYLEHKLWLCVPLYSTGAVGSECLLDRFKSGPYEPWFYPCYVSPFQQWMLSPEAIVGSQADLSKKDGIIYYARNNDIELKRIEALAGRNDAAWRVLPQGKEIDDN